MDTKELIRRWRERRQEILKTLAPELLAEYNRLGQQIEDVLAEESEPSVRRPLVGFKEILDMPRIPLFRHKQKLIDFLLARGPHTRKEILEATGIPPGSLSSILKAKEFEQVSHGLWKLKKGVK